MIECLDDALAPALVHIESHLEQDLSLEVLSEVASMSVFHFQRRFLLALGESPREYVQRLRLEKAAFWLRYFEDPVGEIALRVGFSNHETFTRAFRRHYRLAPSIYRSQGSGAPMLDILGGYVPPSPEGYTLSTTTLQRLGPIPVAFVRHVGPYTELDWTLWERIHAWRAEKYPDLTPLVFGVGHDDPQITPAERVRFDVCIAVPTPFRVDGDIGFQHLPAGTYAVTTYFGPLGEMVGMAIPYIGMQSAQLPGYRLTGLPLIEAFRSRAMDRREGNHVIDFMLPVERQT